MRREKNVKLGNCEKCNKEIWRFGTPFVVEESNIIYKRYLCHDPYKSKEEDCFTSYLQV